MKNDKVLFNSSDLMIDPVILNAARKYLLAYTEIEGNVNNGDPSAENGVYTVRCYELKDLEMWNKVSDIVSYKNNIEMESLFLGFMKMIQFFRNGIGIEGNAA